MNVFVHQELRTPTSDRSVVAGGMNGALYVFVILLEEPLISGCLMSGKKQSLIQACTKKLADRKIVFVLFDRCR